MGYTLSLSPEARTDFVRFAQAKRQNLVSAQISSQITH